MAESIPDGVYALVSTFYRDKPIAEQVAAARRIAQMKNEPVYLAMNGVVVAIAPQDTPQMGRVHWFMALRQAIRRKA